MMNDKCDKCACSKSKLSACALGFALGVTEGLYMMLFAWAAFYFGFGTPMIESIGSAFYGYAPTVVGGLFGGLWGFVDGYIFGVVAGLLYNFCLRCCRCCSCSKGSCTKE